MWQTLLDDLKDPSFTVIAIALDTPEAARPWIEAAKPRYPALIDREHHLAALYNFKNVPEAAWIDEQGRMVRPPETAGAYESFRFIDPATKAPAPEAAAKKESARKLYLEALADWVRNGAESRYAMAADTARSHVAKPTAAEASAHAHFRLGAHLLGLGRAAEAERHMAEASRLHPESWAIWRQAAPKNETGLAADESFWRRVAALGEKRYYPPPPMDGMT